MTRESIINNIHKLLISYTSSIQSDANKNLLSSSVLAEGFVAWLLNTLHKDWNLVNTNQGKSNFRAIDLIDEDRKIAVQVSCSDTPKKVRHTLEQFAAADIPNKDLYELYIVFITMDKPTNTMLACGAEYPGTAHIWSFDNLYERITQVSDILTLEMIYRYLKREIAVDPIDPPPFSLSPSSRVGDGFVGRRIQLLDIQNKLNDGMKPVVLNGLGGIGKTELAIHFGHGYQANCKGHVFFITFSNSFQNTLLSMYPYLRQQPTVDQPTPAQMLEAVLNALSQCNKTDILIVDNVNSDQDCLGDLLDSEVYNKLEQMDIRLILTTRFEWDDAVDVDILDRGELYQVFHRYSPNLAQSDMDALITAVDSHTLTIDLMARMLSGKGVRHITPTTLLDAFRNNSIREEKYRKIATHYKQSPKQAHIYVHLSAVFDLSRISDFREDLLRCATLFPEGGISSDLIADTLTDDGIDGLESLVEHGWLNVTNGLMTIHPVIRLVCRTELTPSNENCGEFLMSLWGQFDPKEYDRVRFAQMAEVFSLAADCLDDREAVWINYNSHLLNSLARYQEVVDRYEQILPQLEQDLSDKNLSIVYNHIGVAYAGLGELEKMLKYRTKEMLLCEKSLPAGDITLVATYNNVGNAHYLLGNYRKALKYQQKALEMAEKAPSLDQYYLATTYNNLGRAYGAVGSSREALEYYEKAANIYKDLSLSNHPDLATIYNNMGHIYYDRGDHPKALNCRQRAFSIRKEALDPNHPDLADSYNDIGLSCLALNQGDKALENIQHAISIWQKKDLPEHPHLATYYNNLGLVYEKAKEYKKALEWYQKALRIRIKVLQPTHTDIATSHYNIGCTYLRIGMYQKGLVAVKEALRIYTAALPSGHRDILEAQQAVNVAQTYIMLAKKGIDPRRR